MPNLPPEKMEGNAGPPSKMVTAVAAYTPNIPWARLGFPNWVDLDGGGPRAGRLADIVNSGLTS